jgi:hypothetical protein
MYMLHTYATGAALAEDQQVQPGGEMAGGVAVQIVASAQVPMMMRAGSSDAGL